MPLVLQQKRRLHLADEIRTSKKLHPALPAVFDVPKGINVPILVHALQKIRWPELGLMFLRQESSTTISTTDFH